MTRAVFARVLSRLHEIGVRDICLTGGEPTDHPDFIDFCRLTLQFGLMPSVVTSARTPQQLKALASASRCVSHITLSADSRAIQSRFQTSRTVETAVAALQMISGPSKSLNLICYRISDDEAHSIADSVCDKNILLELSPLFEIEQRSQAKGYIDVIQWKKDIAAVNRVSTLSEHLFELSKWKKSGSACCRPRMYVTAHGFVRWCPYEKDFGVSLLGPRKGINGYLAESQRRETPRAALCEAVCW